MRKFPNWDQALGFYTALYDTHGLQLAPAIATHELPARLLATATGPGKIGSENALIFVASIANSPIFVASTAGSLISVSSTALTPIAAPWDGAARNFFLRVPKGGAPFRAQSVGTPTPSRTLQPFPMPPLLLTLGRPLHHQPHLSPHLGPFSSWTLTTMRARRARESSQECSQSCASEM